MKGPDFWVPLVGYFWLVWAICSHPFEMGFRILVGLLIALCICDPVENYRRWMEKKENPVNRKD